MIFTGHFAFALLFVFCYAHLLFKHSEHLTYVSKACTFYNPESDKMVPIILMHKPFNFVPRASFPLPSQNYNERDLDIKRPA